MPILEGRSISKHFGGLKAVSSVDFRLEQGEILGLIGPNGAGKTTTVNLLTGILRRDAGEVRVLSYDPQTQARQVRQVKRFVSGIVYSPITLTPDQTLADAKALMDRFEIEHEMAMVLAIGLLVDDHEARAPEHVLEDLEVEPLARSLRGPLDLGEAVGDAQLVVEAIPERMENKHKVWAEAAAKAISEDAAKTPEEKKKAADEAAAKKPRAVAFIVEEECIGCTLCIQACPVDAILGAAKQMHTVIASECTGCDLCLPPCPVDCIEMVPVKTDIKNWKWPAPEEPMLITTKQEKAN